MARHIFRLSEDPDLLEYELSTDDYVTLCSKDLHRFWEFPPSFPEIEIVISKKLDRGSYELRLVEATFESFAVVVNGECICLSCETDLFLYQRYKPGTYYVKLRY